MARINTNISSLVAQKNLGRANENLQVRLQRLATGLRINRGADDPAGLIAADRLRAELRGVEQGVKNSERASNVIATTEAALAEVSDLLSSIKSLVVEAANSGAFSPEEVEANQLQIDSAIESITRISNTASFAGLKLLNGELGYTLSGVDATEILKANVNNAAFGTRSSIPVDVEVISSAQQAMLFSRTDYSSNPPFPAGGTDGVLISTVTLEIAGPTGVQVLTFLSGQSVNEVVTAVNAISDATGVRAALHNNNVASGLRFNSVAYGSEAFVSITKLGNSGAFFDTARLPSDAPETSLDWTTASTYVNAQQDLGKDVAALVNGALATGRGLDLGIKTSEVTLDLTLDETFATTVSGTPSSFTITGGGSLFQLGPRVNSSQQISIGVQSVAASRLGGTVITDPNTSTTELQFLNSIKSGEGNSLASKKFQNASSILDTAIDEIASLRGRLGAFERNTIETNVRSLQAAIENISASESEIRDADFALETSELTRAQILASSSTSVLATANVQAQNVLQLLG
ncbi:MAG: flagellin [Phycisphaeraceae bacterium]|nr:flagellin [Phycisphaeraceae bacterium]MCB9847985.1 flagellin [Phycisphaeraceae bacterium]